MFQAFSLTMAGGRKEFKLPLKLSDSTLVLGYDAMLIRGSGENLAGRGSTTGNTGSSSQINFISTDSVGLVFRTNVTTRATITPGGNGFINKSSDHGEKVLVSGSFTASRLIYPVMQRKLTTSGSINIMPNAAGNGSNINLGSASKFSTSTHDNKLTINTGSSSAGGVLGMLLQIANGAPGSATRLRISSGAHSDIIQARYQYNWCGVIFYNQYSMGGTYSCEFVFFNLGYFKYMIMV